MELCFDVCPLLAPPHKGLFHKLGRVRIVAAFRQSHKIEKTSLILLVERVRGFPKIFRRPGVSRWGKEVELGFFLFSDLDELLI
jgi:hypothetical protein